MPTLQNLKFKSTPIVRGWFVATRFKIEMFAESAPVSPSKAILLVRIV